MKEILLLLLITASLSNGNIDLTPKQIVSKAYDNQNGENVKLNASMKVVRPKWTRELSYTAWGKGRDLGMMQITKPAKDKGIAFLKIKSEGWNWLPSIERVVKISPAQMAQSWMGSDFTNEDVLKEASIINDYDHTLLKKEQLQNTSCYLIKAVQRDDAAVVWGKVLLWISEEDILQHKAEYYDEDNELIQTLFYKDFKKIDGKKIATTWEIIPAQKQGYRSEVKIHSADYNQTLEESFFSKKNLKRLK